MKNLFIAISASALLAACNTEPKIDAALLTQQNQAQSPDTAGLAQFQAWKAQNELRAMDAYYNQNNMATQSYAAAPVRTTRSYAPARTYRSSSVASRSRSSRGYSSGGGSMSSTSSNTARKKGWSKTAKGAVIGGVVGAGTGAVINKKNRAAGAVIGGVIGAGAGAIIGRDMDKRDGRF